VSTGRPLRVVIVGGGAVGAATALFLRRLGGAEVDVTVVERDPALTLASSTRSASSIRQQYSNAINIAMSRFGLEVITRAHDWLAVDDAPVELGYVTSGYLFLATSAGAATLQHNHTVQAAMLAPVALLERSALASRFPWLHTEDIALASLGLDGEGWFDGAALAQALSRKARALGARWRRGEVAGCSRAAGSPSTAPITGVTLTDGTQLPADAVVNAAGPWAGALGRSMGLDVHVHARRRTVFMMDCPNALPGLRQPRTPLVIDPSGVWFRSEGRGFIGGWSPGEGDDDPDDLPLDQPDLQQFDDHVWPALAARVPVFEALRVRSAWAGYYEVHPLDHNALIGPHPDCANFILANGFSGHGLQQSPATGRGVAEWLLHGRYVSLDLQAFSPQRVRAGRPFIEQAFI
jgi:glycine/D-amino acid oxidase-like deaminating enzyme